MKPSHTFLSIPSLPSKLENLRPLAYNLHWAWSQSTLSLFRRLDSDLWEICGHNPVLMLGTIDQSKLEIAANDEGFLSHLEGVYRQYKEYIQGDGAWFQKIKGKFEQPLFAYFSAEFGITECLQIFSGGLGMLAGDHLKSSSDLGLPLVGVGLLYQQGYFSQYLNESGWQQEKYDDNDFHNLPITLETGIDGSPVTVSVTLARHKVIAQIWRAQVGRIPLYLLDTNIPENPPDDRDITDQLYGGDTETRIRQEILLGIGGLRALEVLGIRPDIFHMNEGHSAFLSLERIRGLMETNSITFAEAREAASTGLIFTTHTPVAAGHDYFPPPLMEKYFKDYVVQLGLTWNDFLGLGRKNPVDDNEPFCMTVLALRLASYSNAVSQLHGVVSRQMWQTLWPNVPQEEIPITHVTNGVHFSSWLSREMEQLYERYLGTRWQLEPAEPIIWQHADQIPAEELWRTHERRRERMVAFTRRRLKEQLKMRGASQVEFDNASEVLDPEALTIGFARRFATYKRATLILSDPDRLDKILNNPTRPVQIIFSGKAHPQDQPGKELIQKIYELSRQERFRRRMVFLEDYDTTTARYLVQGCDVWLNNPLRPQEASGTSGMKAAANGVLNLSTLDGWWDEAYQSDLGWAIGRGETYDNPQYQSQVEAEALYGLLEHEVVPDYYDRSVDGLPRRWIARMKRSIQELCHFFNTHRMVGEYTIKFYLQALSHYHQITSHNLAGAKALAAWKQEVNRNWSQIKVLSIDTDNLASVQIGKEFTIRVQVYLGSLKPADVSVELYMGQVDANNEIINASAYPMISIGSAGENKYLFEDKRSITRRSGLHGFTIRVLPRNPDLVTQFLPGLITWA
jgi:glycogen phosphorylase